MSPLHSVCSSLQSIKSQTLLPSVPDGFKSGSQSSKNLEVGDYTDPILTPSGFLILKIDEIKTKQIDLDINKEIQSLIKIETNKQLDQYSNIYFKKIKKNYQIYEL